MTKTTTPSDQPAKAPVRQRTRPIPPPAMDQLQPAPEKRDAQAAVRRPRAPAAPGIAAREDKVGYCSPPKRSQFRPGFDPRRPKGRKAGAKNKASSIAAMMESPTVVRTPEGGLRRISTAEALARKLRELGLSGELAAIAKAFELYHKALPPASIEADQNAEAARTLAEVSAADQAILAAFEEEIVARGISSKMR